MIIQFTEKEKKALSRLRIDPNANYSDDDIVSVIERLQDEVVINQQDENYDFTPLGELYNSIIIKLCDI